MKRRVSAGDVVDAGVGVGSLSKSRALPVGASHVAIGAGGTVFRAGRQIFALDGRTPRLIARAASTPIGLSIEGKRVAWAMNLKGRSRIVALTLPRRSLSTNASTGRYVKRNGDILYGSLRVKNGSRLLYVMKANGTHQRRLGNARNVWSPAWSPGGKWIVYGATRTAGGLCAQLYMMRADGSHVRSSRMTPTATSIPPGLRAERGSPSNPGTRGVSSESGP